MCWRSWKFNDIKMFILQCLSCNRNTFGSCRIGSSFNIVLRSYGYIKCVAPNKISFSSSSNVWTNAFVKVTTNSTSMCKWINSKIYHCFYKREHSFFFQYNCFELCCVNLNYCLIPQDNKRIANEFIEWFRSSSFQKSFYCVFIKLMVHCWIMKFELRINCVQWLLLPFPLKI